MTIFRMDKLRTLKGIGALPEGHTYDAAEDTVWSQSEDGSRVGMPSAEYAKLKLRGATDPFSPTPSPPARQPSRVSLSVGEPEILATVPEQGLGPSSSPASQVLASTMGAGMPPKPVPEEDPGAAEMRAAADDEREARFAAGMGKAGQMFAQAFGAKNADPASFDAIARDAGKRRALVTEHYRAKAQKDADWKRTRGAQTEDLASAREFQSGEKEKDRKVREDEMRQRSEDRLLQRQFMMAMLGQKTQDKKEKDLDKQIEVLSKRTEGAPALRNDLATLDKYAAEKDIPGVGPLAGRMPNILTSDEGIEVRQAAKGVLSTLIREKSGTAASDREVERLMEELGMGDGATEAQFRLGLTRLRQQAVDTLKTKEAGARPEAVQEARRRGLVTSDDLATRPAGGLSDTDKSRLEELRAKRAAGTLR